MKDITRHPVANLFPMMTYEDLQALAADIKEHGQANPILTASIDGELVLVDGRNRLAACKIAGVSPWFREVPDYTTGHLTDYILSLNLHRRNLSASQLATLAVEILPFHEAEAKNRMEKGRPKEGVEFVPQDISKSRDKAAAAVGVNPRYVSDAKRIKEEAPEKFAEVVAGTKGIKQAIREIKSEKATAFPATESHIKTADEESAKPEPYSPSEGNKYATMAIAQLKSINKNDKEREEAFNMVINWITKNK